MMKKILGRGLLGFPLGVFLGYLITILISLGWSNGEYYPVVPVLSEDYGREITAVLVQFLLCGILGSASSIGTVIWEIDDFSRMKQTIIHFLILSFSMLPIAYVLHWVERSILGFSLYFGIFITIYIVIWGIQYIIWKKKIKEINNHFE